MICEPCRRVHSPADCMAQIAAALSRIASGDNPHRRDRAQRPSPNSVFSAVGRMTLTSRGSDRLRQSPLLIVGAQTYPADGGAHPKALA